ncbi:phosphoribosylglycinamide formyltransferase [Aquimarina agarilytica]|uniref:phosphoribosylglycinamide formyltransferase n=1 Tax=Aquimarina agarilytica TaxID=1087449 RepID=UPI0002884F57|nr:formyltransferase family protein [Aquimarina agarilytica]
MSTENKKINWAILVTGWGRNAKDILDAYEQGVLKKSTIKLVIYESKPCGAAEKAAELGIETLLLKKTDFPDLITYQKELIKELKNKGIDYIFMLNYKYVIKQEMLRAFPNKILNIHPSLFPSFLGTKTAIQDAIAYGVKVTGVTTHIIDDKLDEGIILAQKAIKVNDDDDFDSLYPKFVKNGKKIIVKTIKIIEKRHFISL